MCDSLSSVWDNLIGALCKISDVKVFTPFYTTTPPTVFIQFQPNFMESMVIRGSTGYYFFGAIFFYGILNSEHADDAGPYSPQICKFQNATPTVFIRSQPNFMRTLSTMGECRLLLFLA